ASRPRSGLCRSRADHLIGRPFVRAAAPGLDADATHRPPAPTGHPDLRPPRQSPLPADELVPRCPPEVAAERNNDQRCGEERDRGEQADLLPDLLDVNPVGISDPVETRAALHGPGRGSMTSDDAITPIP